MRTDLQVVASALLSSIACFPLVAVAGPIEDILNHRGPLFRKQLELTNTLSKMGEASRTEVIDGFRADYGALQKYQQMEAKLESLARVVSDSAALNTENDRLASKLPTVASAPGEFLARQAMRLTIEAIDLSAAAEIVSASSAIDFGKLRKNIGRARLQLLNEGAQIESDILIGDIIDGLPEDVKALVRQKTESAILRWNNGNAKLKQAAVDLQKKSTEAAGQINSIVKNISDKIVSTNKTAEIAQTALRTDP
jgi:hypothetical protein